MNGLSLFSGIGGLDVALSEYVRPIAYCEIDPYCQGVLFSRMVSNDLHVAPIWDDITNFNPRNINAPIDIIYGGFPCQGISVAGLGKGLEDERSGLFFEVVRLAKEIKPEFIFLENVPAITSRGGLRVVKEIAEMGYDCRWCVISAEKYVDQKRERWFLLAKSNGQRFEKGARERIQKKWKSSIDEKSGNYKLQDMESWASFARSMRENNGVSNKMDRLRALGNAVVTQQAKEAFEILMGVR